MICQLIILFKTQSNTKIFFQWKLVSFKKTKIHDNPSHTSLHYIDTMIMWRTEHSLLLWPPREDCVNMDFVSAHCHQHAPSHHTHTTYWNTAFDRCLFVICVSEMSSEGLTPVPLWRRGLNRRSYTEGEAHFLGDSTEGLSIPQRRVSHVHMVWIHRRHSLQQCLRVAQQSSIFFLSIYLFLSFIFIYIHLYLVLFCCLLHSCTAPHPHSPWGWGVLLYRLLSASFEKMMKLM